MNIKELPIFVYLYYTIDGVQKSAHIQTRGLVNGKQDAKIGDFGENWWIRPRGAQLSREYKTLRAYKTACTLAFKHFRPNAKILGYYTITKIDGIDYEEKL